MRTAAGGLTKAQGAVIATIVYSAEVADITHNVATVRHEILVAGGIALLLALVARLLVLLRILGRLRRSLVRLGCSDADIGHRIIFQIPDWKYFRSDHSIGYEVS